MALNFNEAAYTALNRDKRAAETQNAYAPLQSANEAAQTIGGIGQDMQARREKEKQDQLQQLLLQMKQQQMGMDQQKNVYEYGQPIDPNQMSVGPQAQPMLGKSSFMPGGQGQVASPSPLIERFNQWRAGGMKKQGAEADFMPAMGKDLRSEYMKQNSPETQADVNLKNAQADFYRNKPEFSPNLDARINNQNRNAESNLRSQFLQQSKDFSDTATSYQRIMDSSKNPTAAGDLSMIYNYMKMLDPGSTVREGEFATAQNAGSIPQSILGQYNKAVNGERLAPELRQDFVNRASQLYQGQKKRHDQRVSEFRRIAMGSGVNPDNIIVDVSTPKDGFDTQSTSNQQDMEKTAQPIVQRNKKTGQTRISYDGGKTWQIQQ